MITINITTNNDNNNNNNSRAAGLAAARRLAGLSSRALEARKHLIIITAIASL